MGKETWVIHNMRQAGYRMGEDKLRGREANEVSCEKNVWA